MQYSTHYKEAEKVQFLKQGLKMAGLLFYPPHFDPQKSYPGIVVAHPAGGVKEQCASLYAWHLAREGNVALAFDASYQGESAGEPRFLEDPTSRVEDIHYAIDFLQTRPFVSEGSIGVMGICAGACYAINAAFTDYRVRAVAGVSTWDVGDSARRGFPPQKGDLFYRQSLRTLAEERMNRMRGGDPSYLHYVPDTAADINESTPTVLREGYEYYRTKRGQYPSSENKYLLESLEKIAPFDAFGYNSLSPSPLLLIVGSLADTKYFSEAAYAKSSKPKELFAIEGATHVDLYDKPEYVEQAAQKLVKFFRQHL